METNILEGYLLAVCWVDGVRDSPVKKLPL